jgi:hypothetical protein
MMGAFDDKQQLILHFYTIQIYQYEDQQYDMKVVMMYFQFILLDQVMDDRYVIDTNVLETYFHQ